MNIPNCGVKGQGKKNAMFVKCLHNAIYEGINGQLTKKLSNSGKTYRIFIIHFAANNTHKLFETTEEHNLKVLVFI